MPNETITTTFDNDNCQINIKFEDETVINISTDSDIDLTKLIEKLSFSINDGLSFDITHFDTDDSKNLIIQTTISRIIDSYNESISEEEENVDELL